MSAICCKIVQNIQALRWWGGRQRASVYQGRLQAVDSPFVPAQYFETVKTNIYFCYNRFKLIN